jgi:malto-oligosyltrehalose trehalohydrolase
MSVTRSHVLPQGAELHEGGVRFRLWAPSQTHIGIVIDDREPVAMAHQPEGWFELVTVGAHPGSRYRYVLQDGLQVPDPAARFQPEDVHGPSEVIDPAAYDWKDADWRGRPWDEAVVYELHIGTFTPEGTFRAAIGKLDYLADLGITAIEIMPVADFPGRRNWGYDGVLLYAPDSTYGRPEDLKALIDAAHERGIMVLLDVVYNHFGPDGNYLPVYAPTFFTERHHTPWGPAVNYDGKHSRPVRDFVIQNALYWLEAYHFDGLRFDAVHAIIDDSKPHLLVELADTVRQTITDRPIHLILENEENGAHRLEREAPGKPCHYTAQWNDDVHHVLHVAATGESAGYYGQYRGRTDLLGRALTEGFAFQGEHMEYSGKTRGEPSGHLPPAAFVAFAQNHDQVGNRAFGERLAAIAPAEAVRAVSAVTLLLPQTPMIFMGEEMGATTPFPFFADFDGELADKVREGRREEFAKFPEFQDPEKRDHIPDPLADSTFDSAKLPWDSLDQNTLDWFRHILAVRRAEVVPLIPAITRGGTYEELGESAVSVVWQAGTRRLRLLANLSAQSVSGAPAAIGRIIWTENTTETAALGPWAVVWSIETA